MRSLALLLVSVLLAACAVTPRAPVAPGAAIDPERVAQWSASGRLAMAVANDGGSGSFDWQQDGARTELQVRGPFGVGALRIVTDGVLLSVTDGDGQGLDAEAAREQLRARLGADLPLAELRYWMLGLPAPGPDVHISGDARGVRTIEQAGWQVAYEPFTSVDGWAAPTRLVAARANVRIKVIVDDWRLPPAASGPPGGGQR